MTFLLVALILLQLVALVVLATLLCASRRQLKHAEKSTAAAVRELGHEQERHVSAARARDALTEELVTERARRGGFSEMLGRRVVAHHADRSIRGVLVKAYDDGVVLAHPEWLAGASPAQLGGEIFLERRPEKPIMLQVFNPADEQTG